jgi:nitrate reductase beta subunit
MAKVYNWQLGREMEFPYEARRPDRQFAMIFVSREASKR